MFRIRILFIDDETELGLIIQISPMFSAGEGVKEVMKKKSGLRKFDLTKRSQKPS